MPTSCPGEASVATTSPMLKLKFSAFLKKCFLPFLNLTSTQSNGSAPSGSVILASQSNTVNLLQPSVPQVPLFLHPFGWPFPVEQLVHPINSIYIENSNRKISAEFDC